MKPEPQTPPVVEDTPPPPLAIEAADKGLTIKEIAKRNGHSRVAVHAAVERFGVGWLQFKRLRLFSEAQADFLRQHMRTPESKATAQ